MVRWPVVVHEHEANMAKMLEVLRQFAFGFFDQLRALDVAQRRLDQAFRDFERGLHLDLGGGACIQDREHASHDRGEKVDRRDSD